MPISQTEPGSKAVLHPKQQWELLQCWNTSCFLELPNPLGLWAVCVSGYSPGNKATVPSETLDCSILWLWLCPELTFTWEREQNQFKIFSVRVMEIKIPFLQREKSSQGTRRGSSET